MSELPITPVRLTPEERDLAQQIAEDEAANVRESTGGQLSSTLADGVRIALRAEAKRRKLVPRTAKQGQPIPPVAVRLPGESPKAMLARVSAAVVANLEERAATARGKKRGAGS